jgi:hypothetical protein
MTPVKFEGDSPFSMPLAQSVSAVAQGENILLTIYVAVAGRVELTSVCVQTSLVAADGLLAQLA